MELVLALLALAPLAALLVWLARLPADGDEEELAGLASGGRPWARDFFEREP